MPQIRRVLDESRRIRSVEWIYFEGGEPFLFYSSMLEGIRIARNMGFKVGVVTNAYGAVSEEDAKMCLRPLAELGVVFELHADQVLPRAKQFGHGGGGPC